MYLGILSTLLFSCGNSGNQDSNVNIVNGISDTGQYPAVFQFESDYGDKCTGTFVSNDVVFTAAHCLQIFNKDPARISYKGIKAIDYMVHPDYNPTTSSFNDVGFIKFPPNTAPATLNITSQTVAFGQSVVMVGYGYSDLVYSPITDSSISSVRTSINIKKYGFNTFRKLPLGAKLEPFETTEYLLSKGILEFEGHGKNQILGIAVDGTGEMVSTASGDSGGPLIVNGKVAGILTGGFHQDIELKAKRSYFMDANLNGPLQSFYQQARSRGFIR